MTSSHDEIVEKIRRYRDAHASSLNFDMTRITRDLQRLEREYGQRVVTRPPRKPVAIPGPSSV